MGMGDDASNLALEAGFGRAVFARRVGNSWKSCTPIGGKIF